MMTVALEMINDASTDFKSFNFDYGKMSGNYQDETLFIYTVRVNKYMREKGILPKSLETKYQKGGLSCS